MYILPQKYTKKEKYTPKRKYGLFQDRIKTINSTPTYKKDRNWNIFESRKIWLFLLCRIEIVSMQVCPFRNINSTVKHDVGPNLGLGCNLGLFEHWDLEHGTSPSPYLAQSCLIPTSPMFPHLLGLLPLSRIVPSWPVSFCWILVFTYWDQGASCTPCSR